MEPQCSDALILQRGALIPSVGNQEEIRSLQQVFFLMINAPFWIELTFLLFVLRVHFPCSAVEQMDQLYEDTYL